MIGLPERLCAFCGGPATANGLFFDYAGRARYICEVCRPNILPEDRNRILLTGERPL
jgi:hypothetical protein